MNDIKVIEVFMNGDKVGRMALTPDSLCAFEYDPAYLSAKVSISPFNLPLKSELFIAKRTLFNGGFGVFDWTINNGDPSVNDMMIVAEKIGLNKTTGQTSY